MHEHAGWTCLGAVVARVGATGQTARISDRREARCTPWVVLVDVHVATWSGVAVHGPVLGVCQRLLETRVAQVGLTAPGRVVARLAADKTAL